MFKTYFPIFISTISLCYPINQPETKDFTTVAEEIQRASQKEISNPHTLSKHESSKIIKKQKNIKPDVICKK